MNNKGVFGIFIFFIVLLSIVIIGFMAAMVISIIDYSSDELTPIMSELGVYGDTNMSEVSSYTFTKLDTIIQALPWLVGFSYVAALIFSVIFVLSYTYNPNPAFIGLYFVLIILLIFGCIVMSNMYQDIYSGTDEIATRLQEQTLMSFMLLHSPYIMTLIAFITGIYLFAGPKETGGYGI